MDETQVFAPYLAQWGLAPDGPAIATRSSRLLPVRHAGAPAMLKLALAEEEQAGAALMVWWGGDGAARVLRQEGQTILLERATGAADLAAMARASRDDEATRVICAAVARLHAPRPDPPSTLVPLTLWFRDLAPTAATHGGILAASAAAARALLDAPREEVVLHGDIHHGNILDFGARGWLAIDPKGLAGERAFDYANLFCNPDPAIATSSSVFERRIAIVSDRAGLDRARLLRWVLAWAGLSAAWDIADGLPCETALAVAERAAVALGA